MVNFNKLNFDILDPKYEQQILKVIKNFFIFNEIFI